MPCTLLFLQFFYDCINAGRGSPGADANNQDVVPGYEHITALDAQLFTAWYLCLGTECLCIEVGMEPEYGFHYLRFPLPYLAGHFTGHHLVVYCYGGIPHKEKIMEGPDCIALGVEEAGEAVAFHCHTLDKQLRKFSGFSSGKFIEQGRIYGIVADLFQKPFFHCFVLEYFAQKVPHLINAGHFFQHRMELLVLTPGNIQAEYIAIKGPFGILRRHVLHLISGGMGYHCFQFTNF